MACDNSGQAGCRGELSTPARRRSSLSPPRATRRVRQNRCERDFSFFIQLAASRELWLFV